MKHDRPLARALCLIALIALAISFLASCSPWQTYPKIEGSLSIGSAKTEPVPTLMAESIRYANEKWGNRTLSTDQPVINLPAGTPEEVYVTVAEKIGGGKPMMQAGEPAYHVNVVRVRGLDAEVDLMYPDNGTLREATLYFEKDVWSKYRVVRVRMWRTPSREAPTPNYAMPVMETQPAAAMPSGGEPVEPQ